MLSCFCIKATVSPTFTTQGVLAGVHCYVHQPIAVVIFIMAVVVAVEVVAVEMVAVEMVKTVVVQESL
jgi:hypothetical protein